MYKFWVVWGSDYSIPVVRHSTQEEALKEASRLSIKHPGVPFVVLESIGQYERDCSHWTPHNLKK